MFLYPAKNKLNQIKSKNLDLEVYSYFAYLIFLNYFAFGLITKGHLESLFSFELQNLIELIDFLVNVFVFFVLYKISSYQDIKLFFKDTVLVLSMFAVPIIVFRFFANMAIINLFSFFEYPSGSTTLIVTGITILLNVSTTYLFAHLVLKKIN